MKRLYEGAALDEQDVLMANVVRRCPVDHRSAQLRLSRQVVRAVLVVMLGVGAYLAAAWLVR